MKVNTSSSRLFIPLSHRVAPKIISIYEHKTWKCQKCAGKMFLLILNARCECHADGRHTKPPMIQQWNVIHFLFAVIFHNWLTVGFIYLISNNSIQPWVQHSTRAHTHTHSHTQSSRFRFSFSSLFEWNWRAQAHFLANMQGRAIHAIFFNISTENWISHTLPESFLSWWFFLPEICASQFFVALCRSSWDDAAERSLMHSSHNANSIIIYYFMWFFI